MSEEITPVEENVTNYTTKDLNEGAFVWCQKDVDLTAVNPSPSSNGEVFFFVFRIPISEKELKKLLSNYVNDKALVEPHKFSERQRRLKDRLFAAKGRSKK